MRGSSNNKILIIVNENNKWKIHYNSSNNDIYIINNNKAVKTGLISSPLSGAQPEPVTELHHLTVELASRGNVVDSAHKSLLYLCVQVYIICIFECVLMLYNFTCIYLKI